MTLRALVGASAVALVVAALLTSSCGDEDTVAGSTLVFDLSANLDDPAHFFDAPYPSDLRLDQDGHPDLAGFPNPENVGILSGLIRNAHEEKGFPVIPVAHFQFTKPLAKRSKDDVIPAGIDTKTPIYVIKLNGGDAGAPSPSDGPESCAFAPTVADTPEADRYLPANVLSIAPRPGFVLRPGTRYAFVVEEGADDAKGQPLDKNEVLERLKKHAPAGTAETAVDALYRPLWDTLRFCGKDGARVVAATVFTTATTVQDTSDIGSKIVDAYDITLDGLGENPDPKEQYDEFCYLTGTVTYPQFQTGTPPFDEGGTFVFGPDGLPEKQRDEVAPIILLVPKMPMPAKGYPIMFNIHGSGGYSVAPVRPVGDDGLPGDPIGPAFPITSKGIAIAASAMPVNPERLPGASEIAYLNANNIAAMRDTFRQGAFEQRLFMEAVKKLEIDPVQLGTCTGPTLPDGATSFKFDSDLVLLTGQSMGGMYTNIIGATEPSVKAVVPTGGGGYWTHFIFETPLEGGALPGLFKIILDIDGDLNFLHPIFGIGAAALEPADPIVYMPHIANRPLPGHPVRSVYRPVGIGDSYFSTATYDAVAVSYAHKEAGDIIWPTMQDALALDGLQGIVAYPVEDEMTSEDGTPYTGVVVQFQADGDYDPHALYSHHEGVKHQYACFWDSFVKTGHARVPPPTMPWTAPCE